MPFCNFCAEKSEGVEVINKVDVQIGKNIIKITNLLQIFHNNVVKFLIDDKDSVICRECLKQLKICYEFVQQIKQSEIKLKRGKEIKTEHDYYETGNDHKCETVNDKVTVTNDRPVSSKVINSSLNFKPILPKATTCSDKVYKNKRHLDNKTRLYKCLQCAESFKSFKHLNEHEQDFCKNKFVKNLKVCNFCHKCFSKENSLNTHISLKHANGEYLCCLCKDKVFSAKGYLSRHIQKVHQQESLRFFCGECADFLLLSSQEELREHFLNRHATEGLKTAEETQAQTTLNDEDMDLEMHEEFLDEFLLAHTNENSFQFSECWEALDLQLPDMLQGGAPNLNNAQEFAEAFSCPKCYEQFKNPQPLLRHLADIHNLPVLKCRVCSKCFSSFKDFKRHKIQKCLQNSTIHFTSLECPYCSKTFKNASNLKQHLRIVHCQLKRHICQLCDKQFSTLDHLKKHVLSQHQNERKHLCTICDKRFTQLCHLKQHLVIHTSGKTVQCSECPLKFWRKIDLERHCRKNHVSGGKEK